MPEVPDNVPIYISSDFDAVDDDGASGGEAQAKLPTSREALLEDRSAATWQPYLPPQGVQGSARASESSPVVDGNDADIAAQKALGQIDVASSHQLSSLLLGNRKSRLLVALAAVNLFAFGTWAGFYLIPHEPISSSLKPSIPNLFADASKSQRSATNVIADVAAKA
ncbi:MAG: hypothetical protein C0508_13040, partial [Cyanobacteria bacterium PR.023]|nr:hypothetical protein [Cyanobacteria bacterium PR.023]